MDHEEARACLTAPGAPYERAEADVRGVRLRVFANTPRSLAELYAASGEQHGATDFLVHGDERRTFAQVHADAAALADRLAADFGVRAGDRVAIAMRNHPEWIVAFMAVTAMGAVAVPMNAWWTAEEMVYGLTDSGARLLVVDQQRHDRIAPEVEALDLALLVARPEGTLAPRALDLAEVIAAGRGAAMPAVDIDPDDDATIMYTSGTTGFPKGAVSTHRAILSAVLCFESNVAMAALRSPPKDPPAPPCMLVTVPLFHVTGCHAIFLTAFRPGRRLVLMYKWNAEEALRLIERERVTSFTGVPTMTWEMLQSPNFDDYDTSSLTSIGGGGAPAPPEQVKQVEARFSGRPGIGYGLTETNAVGAQNSGDDYLARPRSTGRPPLVVDIEAFDDAGRVQPRGEAGELWIRGPVVVRGYWNKPEATAESFTDGWFHTGDIGRVDEDGFVTIEDRKKDMVLRGGENVYCAEVEGALYALDGVLEAIVFGLPHERLGEEVAAVIVPKAGVEWTEDEIRAAVAEHIAYFKVPTHIEFRSESLPRNAAGKFLKRAVRDEILAGRGAA